MPGMRRGKGEGTWRKLPSGKWQITVKHQEKKLSATGTTKLEAKLNLTAKQERRKNVRPQADGRSFGTFAESWVASQTCEETTRDTLHSWANSLKRDPLGNVETRLVSEHDLKEWKARQTLANSTLRNRCNWLNQLLAAAGNPARVERPPKKEHGRRPLSPSERAEVSRLLATAAPDILLGAMLCSFCGLRRSEACGLMHEDRDGDGFWIRRVVVLAKGRLIVKPRAKNVRSHGWVPLPSFLRDAVGKGRGFVLGEGDTPLNPKSLSERLERLIAGSSLDNVPFMGTHALRRTYGMALLEAGVDVVTAARSMRHDPKMLLEEYARTRNDLMLEGVERAFGSGTNGR